MSSHIINQQYSIIFYAPFINFFIISYCEKYIFTVATYFLLYNEYNIYCSIYNGGIEMRLVLNYNNGKREVLNENDTKNVIASINYLKLIKFLMSSKKVSGKSIKILDKEVKVDELRSLEILFI